MRALAMVYSIVCYFFGVTALMALILFIGDIILPVTINKPSPIAPGFQPPQAIIWNISLILIWGLQHSIMADPRFKRWWTRFVHPAVERSTFVLGTAVATAFLIAFWAPVDLILWDVGNTSFGVILTVIYLMGWLITLFASFMINHFQLFGLEQAYRYLTETQSKKAIFVTPLLYRIVRHPMMTGILISLWCVPTMTVGRLTLNIVMTVYIILGTRHEEETLVADLGDEYEEYRKSTPMLVPNLVRAEREEIHQQ